MSDKTEKEKFIKRLVRFFVIVIAVAPIIDVIDIENTFFMHLHIGLLFGGVCYIPFLLWDCLPLKKLIKALIIGLYVILFFFLYGKISFRITYIPLIISIVDMIYSVCRIFKMKGGEKS